MAGYFLDSPHNPECSLARGVPVHIWLNVVDTSLFNTGATSHMWLFRYKGKEMHEIKTSLP